MNETIKLDPSTWDLQVDGNGNIALQADVHEACAQDVGSALKTWAGEVYYNSRIGVPWRSRILGKRPPTSVVEKHLSDAAFTVSGVEKVRATVRSFAGRKLVADVRFVDTLGVANGVTLQ